jgi:hypothetical protein
MGHRVESSWPPKFRSRLNLHFGGCNVKCFLDFSQIVLPTTRETLVFEPNLEDRDKMFRKKLQRRHNQNLVRMLLGIYSDRRSRHEN